MRTPILVALSAVLVSAGALAFADGHADDKQRAAAVKARTSQMHLYSFNLATLGAMAKAEVPYDAEAASVAADNLAILASLSQRGYWLPGTDNVSMEGTRALPAIWAEGSDVGAKAGAFVEAVAAMKSAAGVDLGSLQAAMGPLGGSCGACHKTFRAPKN
jgi:cytochrome c556